MPTLGYTGNDTASTDSNADGGIAVAGGIVTSSAAGGTVGAGHIFLHNITAGGTGTQQKTRLVIYKADGAGNAPSTLVGVTNEVIISSQVDVTVNYPSWTSFGGAPILAGSTNYWVGMWWGTQDGSKVANIWQSATTATLYFRTGVTYSTTGNPAGGTWTNAGALGIYDLYFDYTALGGPTMWLRA